jgi:hypothetical protein
MSEEVESAQNPYFIPMDLPTDLSLPIFVYGALKPGMPAYHQIAPFVDGKPRKDAVSGYLFVRDGLPLLQLQEGMEDESKGVLIHWVDGKEADAYSIVCAFEPRGHYVWGTTTTRSGKTANTLLIRDPRNGNPQPLDSPEWLITHDAAFGPGLSEVKKMLSEINAMPGNIDDWSAWPRFYRCQMAYLLLWSILERLSAFCFGPGLDPMERVKGFHLLPRISELVAEIVQREDKVSDSRKASKFYRLDRTNAKKCFLYYYQLRSNLSHRGKGVRNEYDRLHASLTELLQITERYLQKLAQDERHTSRTAPLV